MQKFSLYLTASLAAMLIPLTAAAQLVTGLQGATGSTVGPGQDLFVAEALAGRVDRVDPTTGEMSVFATGLPTRLPGFPVGGVMDVAFIDDTLYALVTLVGTDIGGNDVVGIYRMTGPGSWSVVADIGAFALANPPEGFPYFVPTGLQYSMEAYQGGLLVTDGHHNRVLFVTLDGTVTEYIAFGDIVPTGLAVHGNTVYLAEAGPVPHLPEDGKVVAFDPSLSVTEVGSGAPLLVDVEFGRGTRLYALAQGFWDGAAPGDPASPDTGEIVAVNGDGTFTVLESGVDRPTSFEMIRNTAFVVTLGGEIWVYDDLSEPPFGN